MLQHLLVIATFLASLWALVNMFRKHFSHSSACGGGCSGCNAIDFKKIEQQIKSDQQ